MIRTKLQCGFPTPTAGVIDSHCHLIDPRWASTVEQVLVVAQAENVRAFFVCTGSPDEWPALANLASQHAGIIFQNYGLHPYWVAQSSATRCDKALDQLENWAISGLALGEIGLDFRPQWGKDDGFARQDQVFRRQLQLANQLDKTVVIHSVRADHQVLQALKEIPLQRGAFVIHGFTGGPEVAGQYVGKGGILSIGTGLLRSGREKLEAAVMQTPIEHLLVESDAPDQKLPSAAGLWNEPQVCSAIAQKLAILKGISYDECLKKLYENVLRIYQKEWSS